MCKLKRFISSPERLGLCILLIGHTLASIYSLGFHHPDEHCQILEFANYWVGFSKDASLLRWEYHSQIRPWFQPMLHGVLMKIAQQLGVYEPYSMAGFFRMIYGILNIWGLWALWREIKKRFNIEPKYFLILSTMWFFPYIHVRTSSENLAGIFITFAFASLLSRPKYLVTGLLFGFAFLARYQIALGLFGLGLYLLIKERTITKSHILMLAGFMIPVSLGIVLDRIGYGQWVFTPYRYFKVNLIDGVAATYNPNPWYQYFIWILELNPFVSIPILLGCFNYLRRNRVDELFAFTFSFFILHFFIANKEYRFLFPILNVAVFMAIVGLEKFKALLFSRKVMIPYGFITLFCFSISSLGNASVPELWSLAAIHQYGKPNEIWLTNTINLNPMNQTYYTMGDVSLIQFMSHEDLNAKLNNGRPTKVLLNILRNEAESHAILETLNLHRCIRIKSSQPDFIFHFEAEIPALKHVKYRALYDCNFSNSLSASSNT